jgi:hypothetical protein
VHQGFVPAVRGHSMLVRNILVFRSIARRLGSFTLPSDYVWEMKMKKLLLITAALCAIPASAFADETLKFRSVYHVTFVQSQDVGDIDGHTMSVARASGLASLPDGSVATDNFTATTDYVKGLGPFLRHGIITFSDGSALFYQSNGSVTVDGAKTDNKGTITILGGKGRFQGAKGDGSFAGQRLQAQLASLDHVFGDA